jgi:hypothetical protein
MKILVLFLLAVSMIACGDDVAVNNTANANRATATPTPITTANANTPANSNRAFRPDETPSGEADFEGTAGITEKKNPAVTGVAIMREVRSATHPGYDRVVFEFDRDEMPTYHLEYIDKPVRACGSGDTVPLAGDGWLEVRFTDAQAHTPEGEATIKDRTRSPNLPVVKDLKITCDFESEVTWVAGVSSPNRYRVLELKSPTRLVVDIKHK